MKNIFLIIFIVSLYSLARNTEQIVYAKDIRKRNFNYPSLAVIVNEDSILTYHNDPCSLDIGEGEPEIAIKNFF